MQSGLRSYLIPDGEAIWDSIQTATGPVDSLPDFTQKMADILSDYLSSERRINLPSANCGDAMGNCVVLACLTPHKARTLRTRLGKMPAQPISAILDLYGITATGGTEWADFLCRQVQHFTSENQRLVIVASTPTVFIDEAIRWEGI